MKDWLDYEINQYFDPVLEEKNYSKDSLGDSYSLRSFYRIKTLEQELLLKLIFCHYINSFSMNFVISNELMLNEYENKSFNQLDKILNAQENFDNVLSCKNKIIVKKMISNDRLFRSFLKDADLIASKVSCSSLLDLFMCRFEQIKDRRDLYNYFSLSSNFPDFSIFYPFVSEGDYFSDLDTFHKDEKLYEKVCSKMNGIAKVSEGFGLVFGDLGRFFPITDQALCWKFLIWSTQSPEQLRKVILSKQVNEVKDFFNISRVVVLELEKLVVKNPDLPTEWLLNFLDWNEILGNHRQYDFSSGKVYGFVDSLVGFDKRMFKLMSVPRFPF